MSFIRPITSSGPLFVTTFPLAENPISQGGIWLNGLADGLNWNNCKTLNDHLCATHIEAVNQFDDCIACLKPSYRQFNPAQFVQATAYRTPGYSFQHEILMLLRFNISANSARGYEIYWSTNGGIQLVRWNGALGDFVPLATATPGIANSGDVARAEIDANGVVTVKVNGALQFTFNDTNTIATGNPGVGNNPGDVVNSTFVDMAWDDFLAGNL